MSHNISPVSHSSSASEPLNLLMSHYVSPASMSFKLASKSHHWVITGSQRSSIFLKWASKSLHWVITSPQRASMTPKWASNTQVSHFITSLASLQRASELLITSSQWVSYNPNEPHHSYSMINHILPQQGSYEPQLTHSQPGSSSLGWVAKWAIIHPKRNYDATIHVVSKYPPRFTLHFEANSSNNFLTVHSTW